MNLLFYIDVLSVDISEKYFFFTSESAWITFNPCWKNVNSYSFGVVK